MDTSAGGVEDGQSASPEAGGAAAHRNLSAEINRSLIGSEIEGGVYLSELAAGVQLEVETQHNLYHLVTAGEGKALISGHPTYCPVPVEVRIQGSSWGGSLLKPSFIGRGMRLEFRHPAHNLVTTSTIREIRQRG